PPRASPSAPRKPARPSSAASTAAAGPTARARRASRPSAPAATPSTSAPPMPRATPTAPPPPTPGRSTTPPPTTPPTPTRPTTPSFGFSSCETGSTFECRVDGGGWTPCASPETVSPALGAGSHTFDVRATDSAGNTDGTPASYTWTIDLTAPDTTIDAHPPDP